MSVYGAALIASWRRILCLGGALAGGWLSGVGTRGGLPTAKLEAAQLTPCAAHLAPGLHQRWPLLPPLPRYHSSCQPLHARFRPTQGSPSAAGDGCAHVPSLSWGRLGDELLGLRSSLVTRTSCCYRGRQGGPPGRGSFSSASASLDLPLPVRLGA